MRLSSPTDPRSSSAQLRSGTKVMDFANLGEGLELRV
jgi:hypothetical protein